MDRFKKTALQVGVKSMLKARNFSICDFRNLLRLAEREGQVDPEDMKIFEAMHCIDYADMPAFFRAELQKRLERSLGVDVIDVEVEEAHEVGKAQPGLVRKLRGMF